MEQLLSRFSEPNADPVQMFILLAEEIRPHKASDFESARRNILALSHLLNTRPDLRRAFRDILLALGQGQQHSELYTSTGILPNTGFSPSFSAVSVTKSCRKPLTTMKYAAPYVAPFTKRVTACGSLVSVSRPGSG